ncbi:MAG: IS1634 family transposase [Acidobacteriota bacterium]|nr:IS1634 family transposase [Acidobacteriota bacterium]
MTTRRKVGDKVYSNHLLRHSYREGNQVKSRTVANLSSLPDHLIEVLRLGLKGEAVGPAAGHMELAEARPHGHVAAVVGTMRELGFDRLFATRKSREKDLAMALVAGRVLHAGSKLSLSGLLAEGSRSSTLGQVLGVEGADENELYAAMDWLVARQGKIEDALAKRHLTNGCLVLYDVSSSYVEGKHCPLARFGYSRDHRKDRMQITYGLLCNSEGCPVAVEVFEGNTNDHQTVASQVQKLKGRFGLEHVVLVGDRGMVSETTIRQELEPLGLDWVTALKESTVRTLAEARVITPSLFDTDRMAEIRHPDFPGERLIACFNPYTKERSQHRREDLLQTTERHLQKVLDAVQRKTKPLRGGGEIGMAAGKALAKTGMGKYFRILIQEDGLSWHRRVGVIAQEASLDGIYVIRTKVPADRMNTEQAKAAYQSLSKVERAFRSLKAVDLQIRPIHHRLDGRVRAHVFLCMLAYHVEWHLRRAWEPLLWAEKAPKAHGGKKATGVNEDAMKVMRYRDLLRELAAYTRNTLRFSQAEHAALTLYPTPSPLQQNAFDLLRLNPAL